MTAQIASITLQTTPDCGDSAAAAMAAAAAFIDESPLRLETSGDDSADGGVGDTSQCHLADSGGSGSCAGRVAVKAKRTKKKTTVTSREPRDTGADLACAGFSFVADGSSGPETAFEEVMPRRKVKQLKRERHQNPPPPPLPPPPPDKTCPRKSSPSRKEAPQLPSAKPDVPSASSPPYRRTGSDASSDRPATPEYWDVDEVSHERQSSTADAAADEPGKQAGVEWLPELIMLGGDTKLPRHLAEPSVKRDEAAFIFATTTACGLGSVALNVISPLRPSVTTDGAAVKKQRVIVSVLNKNLSEESIGDLGGLTKADRGDDKAMTVMAWQASTQDNTIATWADMLKVGVTSVEPIVCWVCVHK